MKAAIMKVYGFVCGPRSKRRCNFKATRVLDAPVDVVPDVPHVAFGFVWLGIALLAVALVVILYVAIKDDCIGEYFLLKALAQFSRRWHDGTRLVWLPVCSIHHASPYIRQVARKQP